MEAGESLADELGPEAVFNRLDVRVEDEWACITAEILMVRGRLDVQCFRALRPVVYPVMMDRLWGSGEFKVGYR